MPAKSREEPTTPRGPRDDEAPLVAEAAKEHQSEASAEATRDQQAEVATAVGREKRAARGRVRTGHAVADAAKLPVTALGAVAGDISSAARRPDALLYWGGLAGLAAIGVLEWPVAAAIGVGVAVANGVRRSRV